MRKSVMPDEARALLLSIAPPNPELQNVPLTSAFGRVLAEDIRAGIPIPPFDRSPFDGYAFRGADTAMASADNPITLAITEEIPAGAVPTIDIAEGFAAKILTGAPIPPGADTTIKYEMTEFTDTTVTFRKPKAAGSDVVYAGDDVAIGELAAKRGDVISPATVGLFASLGLTDIPVFRRPRAAIINTGTELVEPGDALSFGKIYNSSVFSLIGALDTLGIDGYDAGCVQDDADEIAATIEHNYPLCDVIITTGGASVGDYDFAIQASEKLGAEILFWKTKLKPGGAMVASDYNGKLILALPGNPGSALMAIAQIAKPFLRRLAGHERLDLQPIEVYLKEPFTATSGRVRMMRGSLEIVGGKAYFSQRGVQGGNALSSFADCDLLAEIPAESPELPAETMILAYKYDA